MKKYLFSLLIIIFLALPVAVLAVPSENDQPLNVGLTMEAIITPVWQLLAGISVVMFIVAGILFVTSNGDPGKVTAARNAITWGVVGIVVATAAFSIVSFVSTWVQ